MSPEDRKQFIESIVETLRVQQERMPGVPPFEKERLSANLGILLYEGLHENAKTLKQASLDLKEAGAASANAASELNAYTQRLATATTWLAILTFLLFASSAWQAYETYQANGKPVPVDVKSLPVTTPLPK